MAFIMLWLLLFLTVHECLSAKIVLMPQFGRSHYIVMERLGDELKSRGHQISILVGGEASYATGNPVVKAFEVNEELKERRRQHTKGMSAGNKTPLEVFSALLKNQQIYCNFFLSSDGMMNELKTADVLIGDSLYLCSTLAADMFDLPHVVVVMSSLQTPTNAVFGLSSNPAYLPQINSALSRDLGFLDRIMNLGYYFRNRYVVERYIYPLYEQLKDKYKIKPGKTIRETLATADMILLTMSIVMDHAQPLPPYVREVGNFLPHPPKPLSAELEEFYETSGDDGVIFVSFGSMVESLSNEVMETMNKAFSNVPQKVLWRINLGEFQGHIARNIKIVRWVPQNDVLGQNKTRLFFTHAGANGMAEAAYHGVPMLCAPFFGDQFANSQALKDMGTAEILNLNSVTVEQLTALLKQIIQDKRYATQVSHVSRILKLSPHTPVEEAAELIEYVHAVGDLKHLRPRGQSLPFYQLYMLDVFLVLGIVLATVLSILVKLLKLLIKYCCTPSKKAKTS